MRLSTDLDEKDLELIKLLQLEGRTSRNTLAEQVGLSSPAVAERMRKLEERGLLRQYTTLLDPTQLALDISAFIHVRVDSSAHYSKFLGKVNAHPEIQECHAVTGDASHLLKIRTHNTSTLEKLLAEIQKWPGVAATRTNTVLSTHKETPSLPLTHAEEIINHARAARQK